MRSFLCSFAILNHFYGPKKGQTWCFQPLFTQRKHTKKSKNKHERNRRYEKLGHFFALLGADLAVSGPVSGPVFFDFEAR